MVVRASRQKKDVCYDEDVLENPQKAKLKTKKSSVSSKRKQQVLEESTEQESSFVEEPVPKRSKKTASAKKNTKSRKAIVESSPETSVVNTSVESSDRSVDVTPVKSAKKSTKKTSNASNDFAEFKKASDDTIRKLKKEVELLRSKVEKQSAKDDVKIECLKLQDRVEELEGELASKPAAEEAEPKSKTPKMNRRQSVSSDTHKLKELMEFFQLFTSLKVTALGEQEYNCRVYEEDSRQLRFEFDVTFNGEGQIEYGPNEDLIDNVDLPDYLESAILFRKDQAHKFFAAILQALK
eukprot:GFYU01008553.1.p1 GENE.GFYU01008553.1~~GFYU01008553.1.p1  ORF type:complete len:295 (-),score=107.66 GFYU01008553.1:346-1230(-)